jgi:hypothetical protein
MQTVPLLWLSQENQLGRLLPDPPGKILDMILGSRAAAVDIHEAPSIRAVLGIKDIIPVKIEQVVPILGKPDEELRYIGRQRTLADQWPPLRLWPDDLAPIVGEDNAIKAQGLLYRQDTGNHSPRRNSYEDPLPLSLFEGADILRRNLLAIIEQGSIQIQGDQTDLFHLLDLYGSTT